MPKKGAMGLTLASPTEVGQKVDSVGFVRRGGLRTPKKEGGLEGCRGGKVSGSDVDHG